MDIQAIASTFADLHAYHRWATRKLLALCKPLTGDQLDFAQPMGPGSLRATLYHIWGAEFLWLSRWKGESPTSFPIDKTVTIDQLERLFAETDAEREAFLKTEAHNGFSRILEYRTLAGDAYSNRLSDLMLHVVNHGVHHRAQCLQFLKLAGVSVPGGLDYAFFRLANSTVELDEPSKRSCRAFGLEVGDAASPPVSHSPDLLRLYFGYGDWGMGRVFDLAAGLSEADLDRDFSMGRGSLRKNLLHLFAAEDWWRGNWRGENRTLSMLPDDTPIGELRARWFAGAEERNRLLDESTPESLQRIIWGDFGEGTLQFRLGETMLQHGVHGTHHRAQCVNILRRLGVETKPFDLVLWLRER
jgi:uncharacterized damage-inducible protein DinB